MDHYGIGAAMFGMAHTYFTASRRTGRTLSLIESVKDGDTIVFNDSREASRVHLILRTRSINARCEVSRSNNDHPTTGSSGRVLLDHQLVELIYMRALENAAEHIDRLQLSRGDAALNSIQARERSRWGYRDLHVSAEWKKAKTATEVRADINDMSTFDLRNHDGV
jgi:hypothetical protein